MGRLSGVSVVRPAHSPTTPLPAKSGYRSWVVEIMALVEAGTEFAREVLRPGGSFLTKVLQGGTDPPLLAALKRDFTTVKHVKPQASRADSAELYLLAMGFRGGK